MWCSSKLKNQGRNITQEGCAVKSAQNEDARRRDLALRAEVSCQNSSQDDSRVICPDTVIYFFYSGYVLYVNLNSF